MFHYVCLNDIGALKGEPQELQGVIYQNSVDWNQ
jgi:hypothetical protein